MVKDYHHLLRFNFLVLVGTVSANFYRYGYDTKVIDYKTSSAQWFTDNAKEYWNNSRADTAIGPAPQSLNYVYYNDYSYNWLGQYRPQDNGNHFSIRLNSRRIKEYQETYYPDTSYFYIGLNTMVHEFGHALYLDHPDDHSEAGDSTIMGYNRDRTNHNPRYQDTENVLKYRSWGY